MAHSPAATPGGMDQAPLALARFAYLRTVHFYAHGLVVVYPLPPSLPHSGAPPPSLGQSLDHEDLTAAMGRQFDAFLGRVAVGMAEKSKAEMEAQMAETGR